MRRVLMFALLLILTACDAAEELTIMQLTPAPTNVPAEEKAPYLYYYSGYHNAFIVERADGTDGTLLGKDVGSPIGSAWSPSGDWLAWWINTSRPPGAPDIDYVRVINIDGTHQSTLIGFSKDEDASIVAIKWSPVADWLLVAYVSPTFMRGEPHIHFNIYDVNNATLLLEYTAQSTQQIYDVGRQQNDFHWASDGQAIVYAYVDTNSGDWGEGYTVVSLDGTSQTYPSISNIAYLDFFSDYLVFGLLGNHAYVDDGWLIINPFTQQKLELSGIDVHNIQQYVTEKNIPLSFVRTPPLPIIVGTLSGDYQALGLYSQLPNWLWDEHKTAIDSGNLFLVEADHLYAIMPDAGEVVGFGSVRDEGVPAEAKFEGLRVAGNTALIHWRIENEQHIYLSRYDLSLKRLIDTKKLPEYANVTDLSPTGRYTFVDMSCLAPDQFLTGHGYFCIFDNKTGKVHPGSPPSTTGTGTSQIEEVFAYPHLEEWVLIRYSGSDGSGGAPPPGWLVTNVTGTVYRELTREWYVMGWLPDQVNTQNIAPRQTPIQPVPIKRFLTSHDFARDVAWNPQGNEIAACFEQYNNRNDYLTIWDGVEMSLVLDREIPIVYPDGSTQACEISWTDENTIIWNDTHLVDIKTGEISELPATSSDTLPEDIDNVLKPYRDNYVIDATLEYQLSPDRSYMNVRLEPDRKCSDCKRIFGVIDMSNGKLVYEVESFYWSPKLYEFSPDSRYIVQISHQRIEVVEVGTWEIIYSTYGYGRNVSWSPDSRYFATASSTGVYIWEVPQSTDD